MKEFLKLDNKLNLELKIKPRNRTRRNKSK